MEKHKIKVSIIIPVKNITNYLRETIEYCKEIDYSDFEIIILPDEKVKKEFGKVKFIP
ncbi:unnamed protein product, partial [marine sediment metagenome]